MKIEEIRELSLPELNKKLRETRDQLVNLRVRKQVGQVENSAELNRLRRTIARFETIKGEKSATAS